MNASVARAMGESVHPSQNWSGMCLKFTRTCLGVGALHASAFEAWRAAGGALGANTHTLLAAPAGVPVFWSGGPHGYGHVAIADGQGYVWSSDILRAGKVDRVAISKIHDKWGLKYLGWSETLNGVRVHPHVDYHGK